MPLAPCQIRKVAFFVEFINNSIRLRDDLSYLRVTELWNDAAETGKGSDVFRFPNDLGAYFLSSRWIILREKLANFLQIGNSRLGPNQGGHYFLSVGGYPLGHIRAAFTGPANNSKRCRTTLRCSSLSLPTKRGNRKNRPKLPNPDRQIQEIFFENRLGYNCQDGCPGASPHLNQNQFKISAIPPSC